MTSVPSVLQGWMSPIAEMLWVHECRGNFLVALQTYRPGAVRLIAKEFDLAFCDFRATYMAPMGAHAGKLTLDRLECLMEEARAKGGIVLHNVEALLAVKQEHERLSWLSHFVTETSHNPVLIPLSIFCSDAPKGCDRVAWIEPTAVPQEKLLVRLIER